MSKNPLQKGWEAMGDGPHRRWGFKPPFLSLVVPLGFIYKALIKDIINKNFKTASEALNPKCVRSPEFGALCDYTVCLPTKQAPKIVTQTNRKELLNSSFLSGTW